jgi:hypothetical protein
VLVVSALPLHSAYFATQATKPGNWTREVADAVGAALYAVFSFVFNAVFVVPSLSQVSFLSRDCDSMFFGFAFGSVVGFTGAVGNISVTR